jgi:F-type H+-transporting ATPase subunit b
MPQLEFATFPPQLIWLAIVFVVLYLVMARFALPRVGNIIVARRERIDGDLEKASAMKAEAEAVIAAYERALAQARQEAQATLKETTEKFAAEAAIRQREIGDKLGGETAAAERRILDAKNASLADLRGMALEVARAAAGKLTGQSIDAGRAGAAVDGVLRERS